MTAQKPSPVIRKALDHEITEAIRGLVLHLYSAKRRRPYVITRTIFAGPGGERMRLSVEQVLAIIKRAGGAEALRSGPAPKPKDAAARRVVPIGLLREVARELFTDPRRAELVAIYWGMALRDAGLVAATEVQAAFPEHTLEDLERLQQRGHGDGVGSDSACQAVMRIARERMTTTALHEAGNETRSDEF